MNPLPRILGLALFIVLAALTALLGVQAGQRPQAAAHHGTGTSVAVSPGSDAGTAPSPAEPVSARAVLLSQRLGFGLALLATGLALGLVLTLALSARAASQSPLSAVRRDMGPLARLAESSAAQDAELSRERDVRRRAEEDARLRQELLAQAVDEKIRLGRDLHDGIIQSLYAVGLTLETIRPQLQHDPAGAERRLDEVRASLNTAIRDVRTYITGLAPENLRRADFARSVATLAEQLRAGRTARFELNVDDEAGARLTPEQHVEALQIVREAISNALRHGEATHITLRLHHGDGAIGLLIQDNGRGFDSARPPGGGHGLANMKARAARLGADLRIDSRPGQGVRVIATFPIPEPTSAS